MARMCVIIWTYGCWLGKIRLAFYLALACNVRLLLLLSGSERKSDCTPAATIRKGLGRMLLLLLLFRAVVSVFGSGVPPTSQQWR